MWGHRAFVSFLKNASKISFWTVASRIGGFFREMMVAHFLGAGLVVDALVLALKLPSFIRRLAAEGTMNTCFIPLFVELERKEGPAAARLFSGSILTLFSGVLLAVTALFVGFTDSVITFLFPKLMETPDRLQAAILYARIIFPFVVLISMTALYGAVLNARNRFSAFAASPFLGNAFIVLFVLWQMDFGAQTLDSFHIGLLFAWAILLSGGVQLLTVVIDAGWQGALIPFVWPRWTKTLKSFFKRLGPSALGAGVAQINLFIGLLIASMLPQGSISFLNYADRLVQLPLSVIGTAAGVALLPLLVKEIHAGKKAHADRQQEMALGMSFLISALVVVCFFLLAPFLTTLVFQRGKFTPMDAMQTARALAAYAWGLPAYIMMKVLSARFFASGDVVSPLKAGVWGVVVDIVLSLILIRFMGHVGIAVATSVSAWVNVSVLTFLLWKKKIWVPSPPLRRFLLKVSSISLGVSLLFFPWVGGFDVATMSSGQHIVYTFFFGLCILGCFVAAVFFFCRSHVRHILLPWGKNVSGVTHNDA